MSETIGHNSSQNQEVLNQEALNQEALNQPQLNQQALDCVTKKLTFGLWTTLGSYTALLLSLSWQSLQSEHPSIALCLVKIAPLSIFIPGFIRQDYRTYSWLCFALLPYFIWIIPLLMGRGTWSDWIITGLIVVLFNAAMMTSRWLQQRQHLRS